MEKLTCAVQAYDWGRKGSQSEVAILMHAGNKQFVIDETKPYAEVYPNCFFDIINHLVASNIYF